MDYLEEIQAATSDPLKLEHIHLTAKKEGQSEKFHSAILACYEETPNNLLFAAWFYRLQQSALVPEKPSREINWALAIPLSILTGLIFWALSDFENQKFLDHLRWPIRDRFFFRRPES